MHTWKLRVRTRKSCEDKINSTSLFLLFFYLLRWMFILGIGWSCRLANHHPLNLTVTKTKEEILLLLGMSLGEGFYPLKAIFKYWKLNSKSNAEPIFQSNSDPWKIWINEYLTKQTISKLMSNIFGRVAKLQSDMLCSRSAILLSKRKFTSCSIIFTWQNNHWLLFGQLQTKLYIIINAFKCW